MMAGLFPDHGDHNSAQAITQQPVRKIDIRSALLNEFGQPSKGQCAHAVEIKAVWSELPDMRFLNHAVKTMIHIQQMSHISGCNEANGEFITLGNGLSRSML